MRWARMEMIKVIKDVFDHFDYNNEETITDVFDHFDYDNRTYFDHQRTYFDHQNRTYKDAEGRVISEEALNEISNYWLKGRYQGYLAQIATNHPTTNLEETITDCVYDEYLGIAINTDISKFKKKLLYLCKWIDNILIKNEPEEIK